MAQWGRVDGLGVEGNFWGSKSSNVRSGLIVITDGGGGATAIYFEIKLATRA